MNPLASLIGVAVMLAVSSPAMAQAKPEPKVTQPSAASPAAGAAPAKAPVAGAPVAPRPPAAGTLALPKAQAGVADEKPQLQRPARRVAKTAKAGSGGPSMADARGCLKHDTNLRVMVCAEKYRYASTKS